MARHTKNAVFPGHTMLPMTFGPNIVCGLLWFVAVAVVVLVVVVVVFNSVSFISFPLGRLVGELLNVLVS